MPARVVLIFVDGLGWGGDDPGRNPCLTYGGKLFDFPRSSARCRPVDACLGVDGLPQSATGQTSLLSGVNAPREVGGHVTGFPTPALREILRRRSVFVQLRDRGRAGIFLNAFRPVFFELPPQMQWRLSATTVAQLAAGLPFFGLDDIAAGRSIYQEFTNRELIDKGFDVPEMTPAAAGRVLARNAALRDFTLFEYFQTDRAGHGRDRERCEGELTKLEMFLNALLADVAGDTLVLLTSDHGNLEDLSTRSHTCNPVPLMAWGPGAEGFAAGCGAITDVVPAVMEVLGEDRAGYRT
ncbi:metalloenzyme [bacterium]|nr:metalloenzyme [bacterium]